MIIFFISDLNNYFVDSSVIAEKMNINKYLLMLTERYVRVYFTEVLEEKTAFKAVFLKVGLLSLQAL